MSLAEKLRPVSVEDYLAAEATATVKHEYVGGALYAMTGARNAHNLIATNIVVALGARLRGTSCRPFNSDTKIRIRLPSQVRFYYPDVSVVCRQNPQTDAFQDEPAVIVEVVSRGTRRIDEGEKKDAYLAVPTVKVYLLVAQDLPAVVAFRRTDDGFVREIWQGLDTEVALPEIGTVLPLADVYDTVEFAAEPE
jgi:Uma2 family endonuclease